MNRVLLLIAVVCFALVGIHDLTTGFNWNDLVPIGLAAFAGSFLV